MLLFIAVVLFLLLQVGFMVVDACVAVYIRYARLKFRILALTVVGLAVLVDYHTADLQRITIVAEDGVRNLTRTYDHLHTVSNWINYANSTVGTFF